MWYPTKKRITELSHILQSINSSIPRSESSFNDFLKHTSSAIHSIASANKLPSYRIWDWIWIGSQLRIHRTNSVIAKPAFIGLNFLLKWSEDNVDNGENALTDIRWVTEETINLIEMHLGKSSRKICLSEKELGHVNDLWSSLHPSDQYCCDEIKQALGPYLDKFSCFCGDGYVGDVCNKINYLIDRMEADSDEALWAVSALRYLVCVADVVPDDLGYFGLVDDIYVIEQTVAIIENEGVWKSFLNVLNQQWPCISETIFSEEYTPLKLPDYLQTVSGAVLHELFHKSKTNLVLSDKGPVPLLCSFLAVINSIRNQTDENKKALEFLSVGDHVILKSSGTVIKAIYSGTLSMAGEKFHSIKLSKDSTVSISDDVVTLMRKAPEKHSKLSPFSTFHEWKQNYSPHPLSHLIGSDVNLDTVNPEILLITRKNNLEWFHSRLKPVGSSIASLMGVRYVTSNLKFLDLPGTTLAVPLLWCCSDTSVAVELIENEKFRSQFNPKSIIIDAELLTSDSVDLVSKLKNLTNVGVVSISGLHEIETLRILRQTGFGSWHISLDDVEPAFHGNKAVGLNSDAELSCFYNRHKVQRESKTYFHGAEHSLIERLEVSVRRLRQKTEHDPDSGLDVITIIAATLLGTVRKIVLCPDENELAEIHRLANNLSLHCNTMMHFDEEVGRLYQITTDFCSDNEVLDAREQNIRKILQTDPKRPVAVLCPSSNSANLQKLKSTGDDELKNVQWLSIDGLRKSKSFGTVIIPGWFNKLVMRQIRNCGFAEHKYFIYFPFEKDWDSKSSKAGLSSLKELYVQNEERLKLLGEEYGFRPSSEWSKAHQANLPPEDELSDPSGSLDVDDLSHSEWVEARMADSIRKNGRQKTNGAVVSKGKLMIFETPGFYMYLPPNGKVICLSNVLDASNNIILNSEADRQGVSENLINWPVKDVKPGALLAFPEEKRGNILDSLANKIIKNPVDTRRIANLWRESLKQTYNAHYSNLADFCESLEESRISRTETTLNHWLFSDDIIAPQHCDEVIPAIAEFTGDVELKKNLQMVLSAIDRIYKARRKAAGKVVEQILQGDIDHEEGILSFKYDGQEIIYRILRVKNVDPPTDVLEDKVGVLHYLMT